MAKVLVAGGAGFIGSHLCSRLLKDGYEVICVDNLLTGRKINIAPLTQNPSFTFVEQSITDTLEDTLRADFVFHLASPASPNHHSKISYHALPLETLLANTMGTLKLLEFCERHKAKFLFASTSEVYGDPLEHPQKEEYRGNVSTTGPRSHYDEAKRFGETITAYFWRFKNVDARIVRIFNTYGPHMHPEDMRMIVNFIMQATAGKPITVFGDGSQTRSLCYIDDLVDGLMRFMFSPNTTQQIVNLGSDKEHTIKEYAQLVKELTQSQSEIVLSEDLPQDDPKKRRPDITKAKELLGWSPQVSLQEGLQKMIEYVKTL